MKLYRSVVLVPCLAALLSAGAAHASSSTSNPENWRLLTGQTFNGVAGALDGIARIRVDDQICSGSLLAGGAYVLTAAHCASGFSSMAIDFGVVNNVAAVTRTVSVGDAFVHPGWNGTLSTGADLAIVKLNAPVTTFTGFQLSSSNDVGREYLIAGYGMTSTGSSFFGPTWSDWGYAHYGYNTFDTTAKIFNDAWDGSGNNRYGETYVSDFDPFKVDNSGRYNSLQRVADLTGNRWSSDGGLGAREALLAFGDSGGGDYVWDGSQWLLSGVHSWTWEFCDGRVTPNCDYRPGAASSYGDLSGSTAVFSNIDWINGITSIPEAATRMMMLGGIAAITFLAWRRRP